MRDNYDVIVVGAGPAGIAAAIRSARAGRRVLLVEQRNFPREKVCGGCLSGLAMRSLRHDLRLAMEPSDGNPGCPGTPTKAITFVRPSGRAVRCHVDSTARLVSRAQFDAWLVDHAHRVGVEISFGTPARLCRDGNRYLIETERITTRADAIVLATGLGNVGKTIGIRRIRMRRPMIGMQWTIPSREIPDFAPDVGEVAMHWLDGGYIGISRPSADVLHFAAAVDAHKARGIPPLESLHQRNSSATVWRYLPKTLVAPLAVAGFPSRPAALGRENVLLAGDAAGYAEPFSGEGIGWAMQSGILAAESICSERAPAARLACYEAMMHKRLAAARVRCLLMGTILRLSLLNRIDAVLSVMPSAAFAWLIRRVHARA